MKILHVYKDYPPVMGGIENHIADLAREQARRGHDVTVLVTGEGRRTERAVEDGVRILRAGRWLTAASTPISLALFGELGRLEPDVTHLHFPYPVGEVAHLLLGRGRATVITYHGDIVRQKGLLRLYEPLLTRTLERADRILATSEPYVRSSRFLSRFAGKTEVVPLGIAHERFARVDAAGVSALKRRLAPGGETILLSVGRLRYYKGLDVALRAFALLPDLRARLVLIGSGPMEAELRALASTLSLGDRVLFAGEIPDTELPQWFQAADAYVSSASHRSEAFGISIVEAMAAARPVITTELGTGTSFVNQHGVTGLVVPANDPAALAGAMRTLVTDPPLRERYGSAARDRVAREFTLSVMTDRVLDVYERVLRERASA